MTVQAWLDRHGYFVEFNRRGFRFETSGGGVSNVFVIEDGVKAIKHITFADVYNWAKQEIKRQDSLLSRAAKEDFNAIIT